LLGRKNIPALGTDGLDVDPFCSNFGMPSCSFAPAEKSKIKLKGYKEGEKEKYEIKKDERRNKMKKDWWGEWTGERQLIKRPVAGCS
jgi:hypothetical protein